jgi:hypothetical protein
VKRKEKREKRKEKNEEALKGRFNSTQGNAL